MKKRTIGILCGLTLCGAFLTGCNKTVLDTNYTFDTAIITIAGETHKVKIDKWCDYEGEQLQLVLKDGSKILVSSYNTILIKTDNGESELLDLIGE